MNFLRGDIPRMQRCVNIVTGGVDGPVSRCKPLMYAYEKEIVLYAYFKKLDYFATECPYSVNAYRGFARDLLKQLESVQPRSISGLLNRFVCVCEPRRS